MSRKPAGPTNSERPTLTAYLAVDGATEAIAFYCDVFGAVETMRIPMGDGKLGHAELLLGDSMLMIADEFPEMDVRGPKALGGSPVSLSVYVDDVDATVEKAVGKGATVIRPAEDQFHGNRAAKIADPFGHIWQVTSVVEDLSGDEIVRRAKDLFG